MVGNVEQRVRQVLKEMPTLAALDAARMVRLDEFIQGFISVEELFSDPPPQYVKEAVVQKLSQ